MLPPVMTGFWRRKFVDPDLGRETTVGFGFEFFVGSFWTRIVLGFSTPKLTFGLFYFLPHGQLVQAPEDLVLVLLHQGAHVVRICSKEDRDRPKEAGLRVELIDCDVPGCLDLCGNVVRFQPWFGPVKRNVYG